MFSLTDYQFTLPKELIAENASQPAHNARLLTLDKNTGEILKEDIFWNLDQIIPEDRILFFNDSRVVRARILLQETKAITPSWEITNIREGEIFFLRKKSQNSFEALVRPGKKFKIGTKIILWSYELLVTDMTEEWRILEYRGWTLEDLLEAFWSLPLPHYIEYQQEKEKDYQTVFAKKDWSVAAPTASLHFTKELLLKLPQKKYFLTLHVGLWTFQGINTDDVRDYKIHDETAEIELSLFETIAKEKRRKKKILAIGTTSCRTLESLPSLWKQLNAEQQKTFSKETRAFWEETTKTLETNFWVFDTQSTADTCTFKTQIYITPGYEFRVVDELITNFHLPGSSLLVLVAALIGNESLSQIYTHAIENQYRFFSLWDGMYIQDKYI